MDVSAYSAYLSRFYSALEVEQNIECVRKLERWLAKGNSALETATVRDLRAYLKRLIRRSENTFDGLFCLVSYYEYSRRVDLEIYLNDAIYGALLLEDVYVRVLKFFGFDAADRLERCAPKPPIGTDPSLLPEFTVRLIHQLHADCSEADVFRALIEENELLPSILYETERALFLAADSLDDYLLANAALERLKMRVLQRRDWKWKQVYFSEEYVRRASAFQELLAGVRRGNRLYVTLPPFLPGSYAAADTLEELRYFACHDPCVRAALRAGKPTVPALWCERCVSHTRQKFAYILGRPLNAELVESALLGDTACRIAILLEPEAAGESEPD